MRPNGRWSDKGPPARQRSTCSQKSRVGPKRRTDPHWHMAIGPRTWRTPKVAVNATKRWAFTFREGPKGYVLNDFEMMGLPTNLVERLAKNGHH